MFDAKAIGARLRARRIEATWGMRRLEEESGVGIATISEIENGQPEMRAGAFFAICEALRIDPLRAWYGDERGRPAKPKSPITTPPPSSAERETKRPGK